MQRIINARVKKSRARRQAWECWKIKRYSKKVVKYIVKQYKKTGETVIQLDMYKFNEEKLIKVLEMLTSEKQIRFKNEDDLYIITLVIPEPKPIIQKQVEEQQKPVEQTKAQEETKEKPLKVEKHPEEQKPLKNQVDFGDYKPF